MAGKAAAEIAVESYVSIATIRSQIKAILRKLEVNSQLAAVALAYRSGWSRMSLRATALQAAAPSCPLLGGDGVADVVLPASVDLEVAHRHALVAEAELLHDPAARRLRGMIAICRRCRRSSSNA